MKRGMVLLLIIGVLFAAACGSESAMQPAASDTAERVAATTTKADWITAWTTVALAAIALGGFVVMLLTIITVAIQARNRQQLEVEGYVRVDIGPTQGADGYTPPTGGEIAYVERSRLETLGNASQDAPTISVWYRNLQTHPLGVVFGLFAKVAADVTDLEGRTHKLRLTHEVPYVEPKRCVRLDFVRFPPDWQAQARIEAIKYRNLHWDGSTPKHGRRECEYKQGEFSMIPWSAPIGSWRDRGERLMGAVKGGAQRVWSNLRGGASP